MMSSGYDFNHPSPLSVEAQNLVTGILKAKRPAFWQQDLNQARRVYTQSTRLFDHSLKQSNKPQHFEVDTRDGAQLQAALYRGDNASLYDTPTIIFIHGGGFVLGGIEAYEGLCGFLAEQLNAAVVAIAYRLAPEYPFPYAVHDVQDSYEFLYEHAAYLGLDKNSFILVGESAGAHLAAQLALGLRHQTVSPCGQVFIYPSVSAYQMTASRAAYTNDVILSKETLEWFMLQYLEAKHHDEDPNVNLLAHSEHEGLAPSLFILAQCDPLVDEGIRFAQALEYASNSVSMIIYEGMPHAFFMMQKLFPQTKIAQQTVISWIKQRWEELLS